MAKLNREDFISALKEMTILEIKELVDAMKEEFGVDPSAVAVAAGPVAAVEEGPSKVNVVLTAAGANKIAVIKIVRDLTGLGLKEAKEIADNGGNVKEGVDMAEAEKLKAQFEEAGADYKVYKNTLTKRALNELNIDMSEYLAGPSAIAFGTDEL